MERMASSIPTNAGNLDRLRSGCRAASDTPNVVAEMAATLAVRSGHAAARCNARKPPMEWPTRFHRR